MSVPADKLSRANETDDCQREPGAEPHADRLRHRGVLAVIFFLQNGEQQSIDFWVFEWETTVRWTILIADRVRCGLAVDRSRLWWHGAAGKRTTRWTLCEARIECRRPRRRRDGRPRARRQRTPVAAVSMRRASTATATPRSPMRWPTSFTSYAVDYRGHGDTARRRRAGRVEAIRRRRRGRGRADARPTVD